MDDWIKQARRLDEEDEEQRRKERRQVKSHTAEMIQSEKNWIERVHHRIDEVRQQGIPIKMERRPAGLVLSHRGTVDVEFLGSMNFKVRFHDVLPASILILSHPITVRHYRVVRLRSMNEHNLEEILKFVSLGMDKYTEVATYERIERNLAHVLESSNQEEHVKGDFKKGKL